MSKSQKIFIIVFTVLLLVMSTGVISLYDNIQEKAILLSKDNLSSDVSILFQKYTLSLVEESDSTYQILSFQDNVSQKDREIIKKLVQNSLNSNKAFFEEDKNFYYSIKNTKTNKVLENQSQAQITDKYYFQQTLNYDQKGHLTGEGSLYEESFEKFSFQYLFQDFISYDNNGEEYISNTKTSPTDVIIQTPKNVEITYHILKTGANFNGITSYIMDDIIEIYFLFAILLMTIYSIILFFFILFYPIRIVEEVNPFMTIKQWKAEVNICLLITLLSLAITGTIFLTGYTLTQALSALLNSLYIQNNQVMILSINFIAWLLTLLLISLGLFECKYMFAHGFIRFLKEDTILGTVCRYIKRKLNMISQIDLSKPLEKDIMKYVLINTAIIIVLITFSGFGYILAIIYAFVAFFWLKDRILEIQDDYQKLFNATTELAKGHFHEEINEDIGIFNGLKNEFNNIKIGFKKAVEEETKSQNMKTELITNVSHDLKTPLTCIKNYIVLLQDDQLTQEERHEYLNSLNQYSNRLTTLIEDLFEVSKVNSGNIQLDIVELNIIALLKQAIAECQDVLESKELTIINHFDQEEISLYLDGDKTYRIFENLLTNISKYALSKSRVYIDVKEQQDEVIIEFKNISEAQMNFTSDEIVERFVRGDKSRHESGSGLGLAIAKSFTEIQNGQFDIKIDGDLFKVIITF